MSFRLTKNIFFWIHKEKILKNFRPLQVRFGIGIDRLLPKKHDIKRIAFLWLVIDNKNVFEFNR